MRNIEFRGKPKDKSACACAEDNGFVYGGIAFDGCTDETYITRWNSFGLGFIENVEVDPATVGQFTGLYDKNDKPVFDGDILQFGERRLLVWWNGEAFQWQAKTVTGYDLITFDFAQFGYNWTNIDLGNIYSEIPILGRMSTEIIGNIHDNPELIQ